VTVEIVDQIVAADRAEPVLTMSFVTPFLTLAFAIHGVVLNWALNAERGLMAVVIGIVDTVPLVNRATLLGVAQRVSPVIMESSQILQNVTLSVTTSLAILPMSCAPERAVQMVTARE